MEQRTLTQWSIESLVGSPLYLTVMRPAITYAVSLLSSYMSSPNQLYLAAAKQVLRYIKGMQNYEIRYKPVKESKLVALQITIVLNA